MEQAKRYERVGQMMIRPLLVSQDMSAYDLAKLFYAQYNDLDFHADLSEYMRNGYVVARPKLFCMARPILYEGERIWYLRVIIGNLLEAISCLPCMLPKVAYCRNNNPEAMVVADTEAMIRMSIKMAKRVEKNGSEVK